MEPIEIVRAATAWAEELSAIAQRSKAHWGYPRRYLEIWKPALTLTPRFVSEHHVYAATSRSARAGLYALRSCGHRMEMEHLWVDPPWIGKGVGRALLEHAVALARDQGAEAIDIDSDPNAVPFYEWMGAQVIGRTPAHIEGTERYLPRMELKL